mmetsp:Transcript_63973/g.187679  ORF Transcript_63973/g.187679 Transcript_63973/m.187679 type:complete len:363 (-) Transcript_63973:48-1136(-)
MSKGAATFLGLPLKWIALVLMIAQMVGMVFILRVSRTQHVEGPRYLNTTAIFFSEAVKFVASFALHCWTCNDLSKAFDELLTHTWKQPRELLKASVPSLLYTAQNNLLFIGLSHLSAATYQVTYQFKILTTAGLSVVVLGTRLSAEKWFALLLLTAGVACVNTTGSMANSAAEDSDSALGLSAVLSACVTSGLAGVYLEKMLKQSNASLWVRNMQLALFGACFAFVIAERSDGELIRKDGWTQGYSSLVWFVVVWQAVGGLVVAAVMKYADNILKCFGCAIAILFTCLLSVFELQEFTPDGRFLGGTVLVLVATGIYSLGLPTEMLGNVALMPLLSRFGRRLGGRKAPKSPKAWHAESPMVV